MLAPLMAVALAAGGLCAPPSSCQLFLEVEGDGASGALVQGALEQQGFRVVRGRDEREAAAAQAKALGTLDGDALLAAKVGVRASTASKPGELTVTVASLHRPKAVYGEARKPLPVLKKAAWQETALKSAARWTMQAALDDLSVRIRDAAGKGERVLPISIRVNALDQKARAFIVGSLVPCVARLFDAKPPATAEVMGYLEGRLLYRPAPEEPRNPLAYQVDRVKSALKPDAKGGCSLTGSGLERRAVRVSADENNRGVVIELE